MADCPCKTCTRVENPKECVNKFCTEWKWWFIGWWNRLHRHYEAQLPQEEGDE